MTAEMFSVIHSRKSHAYILVFVRTGNEAWWLQISIETCLHIIWHSHLSSHVVMTEAKESREGVGPNTDDRVGVGRDPGCLCLPSHPTNKREGLVVLWAGPQMGALWAAEKTPQFSQNYWYEGKDHDRGDKREKSCGEGKQAEERAM